MTTASDKQIAVTKLNHGRIGVTQLEFRSDSLGIAQMIEPSESTNSQNHLWLPKIGEPRAAHSITLDPPLHQLDDYRKILTVASSLFMCVFHHWHRKNLFEEIIWGDDFSAAQCLSRVAHSSMVGGPPQQRWPHHCPLHLFWEPPGAAAALVVPEGDDVLMMMVF